MTSGALAAGGGLRHDEFAAAEVPAGPRQQDGHLQGKDPLAVQVLVQAVVVACPILQDERAGPPPRKCGGSVADRRAVGSSGWRWAPGADTAPGAALAAAAAAGRNTCTRPARSRGAPSRYGCDSRPAKRIRQPERALRGVQQAGQPRIAARVERARDGFNRGGPGPAPWRRFPASSAALAGEQRVRRPSDSRIARHRPAPRDGREWPRPARWRRRRRPRRARRRARRAGAPARRSCGSGRPGWRRAPATPAAGRRCRPSSASGIGVAVVDIGGDGGQLGCSDRGSACSVASGKAVASSARSASVRAQQNRADAKLRLAGQDHAQRGLADGVDLAARCRARGSGR